MCWKRRCQLWRIARSPFRITALECSVHIFEFLLLPESLGLGALCQLSGVSARTPLKPSRARAYSRASRNFLPFSMNFVDNLLVFHVLGGHPWSLRNFVGLRTDSRRRTKGLKILRSCTNWPYVYHCICATHCITVYFVLEVCRDCTVQKTRRIYEDIDYTHVSVQF